jgi:TolB protein
MVTITRDPPVVLPQIASLEDLDSYRFDVQWRIELAGAQPWEAGHTLERVGGERPATHTVMFSPDPGHPGATMRDESIIIGDTWWTKERNGTWQQGEDALGVDPGDDFWPLDELKGWRPTGEETVNEVHCQRYALPDGTTLSVATREGTVDVQVEGALWLVDQPNLPPVIARQVLQWRGAYTPVPFPGLPVSPTETVTTVLRIDLRSINQAITIEAPIDTPSPLPPTLTASPTPSPSRTRTPTPTAAPTPTAKPRATRSPAAPSKPQGKIAFCSERDGNREIYLMNADSSGVTRLTHNDAEDMMPAWSPDGKWIAFTSYRDGNYEIYVMNADGSNQRNLTNNTAQDWHPAWSPDGRRIAFHSEREGNYDIYVMNADGSGQGALTRHHARDWCPSWSPDGRRIAFTSNREGSSEIYVMNADGGGKRRLTTNLVEDSFPSWSPDAKRIAYSSWEHGNWDVYVMGADGSDQRRVTTSSANDRTPVWSADGKYIAFDSDRSPNWDVFIIKADGTELTRLTKHPAQDYGPSWLMK